MTHTNDEIEELESLKQAASERRARRAKPAKPVSKKKAATRPVAGSPEDDGESPPPASESEAFVDKLTDQVETIFGEISEASRERPVLALVSAFAVGILIGHIFSKRQG